MAVLVFSGALLVGAAPPCLACSCIAASDQEHYQRADVVFTGKATERHDPSTGGPQGSADPIHWTFDVDGVQKSRTDDPVVVETTRDEASCGVTFVVGRRYQVYATSTGEYLHTDLCSGTRELNASQGPYIPATPAPTPVPATPSPVATAAPSPTVSPSPSPTPTATPTPVATASPTPTEVAAPTGAGRSAAAAVAATLLALTALGLAIALTFQRSRSS